MKWPITNTDLPTNKKLFLVHTMNAGAAPGYVFDSKDEALAHASSVFETNKGAKPAAIYEMTDIAVPVIPKVDFQAVK